MAGERRLVMLPVAVRKGEVACHTAQRASRLAPAWASMREHQVAWEGKVYGLPLQSVQWLLACNGYGLTRRAVQASVSTPFTSNQSASDISATRQGIRISGNSRDSIRGVSSRVQLLMR